MSFLDKVKYAIGIGNDDDDDDLIKDDPDYTTPTVSEEIRQRNAAASVRPRDSRPVNDNVINNAVATDRIFENVVRIFVEAQPDFISRSIDPARARQQLLDALEDDIRQYLQDLKTQAEKNALQRWKEEKVSLQANLSEIQSRMREFDEKRNELTRKHLDSERERKALNARVQSLNQRIMTLEAEKEQSELECKSLVNKLKVAMVYEKENEDLRTQIQQLEASGAQSPQDSSTAASSALNQARLKNIELEKQLKDLRNQNESLKAASQSAQPDANTDTARLNAKIEELSLKLEQSKDTSKSLADENASLRNQIIDKTAAADAEIEQLKRQIHDLTKHYKSEEQRPERKSSKAAAKAPANDATPIEDILSDTEWGIPSSSLKGRSMARADEHGRRGISGRNKGGLSQSNDSQPTLF